MSLPAAETKAIYQPIRYTSSRDGSLSGINHIARMGQGQKNPNFFLEAGVYYSQNGKAEDKQRKPRQTRVREGEQSLTSGAKHSGPDFESTKGYKSICKKTQHSPYWEAQVGVSRAPREIRVPAGRGERP